MKTEALLTLLEETAERLSIKLDYDHIRKGVVTSPGGSYRLNGKDCILIEKSLTAKERAELLTSLLSKYETDDIFLPPEIRDRFEKVRAEGMDLIPESDEVEIPDED